MKTFKAVALVIGILLPAAAHAADIDDPLKGRTFEQIIKGFTDFAQTVVPPLAAIMVLFAGLLYMFSGGDPERVKKAHRTLVWTLIGIAIILLAGAAIAIIKSALGIV